MGRARADAQRARSRGRARAFGRDPVLLERRRERRRAPVTLAELQRYFAAVATSTSGPPSDIDDVFQSSARLSASARLAIYNRGYHPRLRDARSVTRSSSVSVSRTWRSIRPSTPRSNAWVGSFRLT